MASVRVIVANFISERAKMGQNVSIWHFTCGGDDVKIRNSAEIDSLVHVDHDVKIGKHKDWSPCIHFTALKNQKKCIHQTDHGFDKRSSTCIYVTRDAANYGRNF